MHPPKPECTCEFCQIQRLGEQKRKLEDRVAELEAGRADLISTIEAMNEENAQLAHRLWCLENPE